MKLQTRFMINLGLVGLSALAIFAYIIRLELMNLLNTEIQSQLSNHQSLSVAFVNRAIENMETDLDLIANDATARQYFSANEATRYQLFHSELTRILQRYLKYSQLYNEIAVVMSDGFKEVYVSDGAVNMKDTDLTLIKLTEGIQLKQSDITFIIESQNGIDFLSAYYPFRQYSSLINATNNPVVAYIKVSVSLQRLLAQLDTGTITAVFLIQENNGQSRIVTAENQSSKQQIPFPEYAQSPILDDLILRSSLDPEQYNSNTKVLFQRSLVLMLISLVSLIIVTFGLLRLVILKPLEQFSRLIDQADFTVDVRRALNAYEQNEFGSLKQRFDHLMGRLESHSTDLQRQAFTDTLTKLPNRAALNQLLENHAQDQSTSLSVLFLDLDGFKKINDIYGHDMGDMLLTEVAQKLAGIIRGDPVAIPDTIDIRHDAVFRLGGDEFTIVLMAGTNSELVAQRIINSFQNGLLINDKLLYTGASIGISEYPVDTKEPGLLMQYADMAMYQAKKDGKMRYCRFTQEMAAEEQKRASIEEVVREGIEFNRFDAYFQSKLDARTGQIVGFEALARLRTSDQQMISPTIFIPIAQEEGVLEYITYLVCEKACQLLKNIGNPDIVASINISPSQLNDLRMIADIRIIMWRYHINPQQIEFEITEEELITNFKTTSKNLDLLRKFGFRTALDDFGSGYSSLGQLKTFRFDALKLDRVFINTEDFSTDSSIGVISSIKALADRLNMDIVAEGIETASQLTFIQSFGIHIIQGYYFSRPQSADDFLEQCQNQHKNVPAERQHHR